MAASENPPGSPESCMALEKLLKLTFIPPPPPPPPVEQFLDVGSYREGDLILDRQLPTTEANSRLGLTFNVSATLTTARE